MAKQDFIPKRDGDLDSFEENFVNKYPTIAAGLGIAAGDITNTTTILTTHRTGYTTANTKKAESKSANEANKIAKKNSVTEIRRAAGELKKRPGYTTDMGDALNINGPEAPEIDVVNIKPVLTAMLIGGEAVLDFSMNGTDGINVYSRRPASGETEFVFLVKDTNPPAHDNRPKLDPTKPEKREYCAFYFLDDDEIGQQSDVVSITIP